ncbi:DNA helicase UvrD [Candidatus Berkelbacteria bacterium]|nr:DNA helicase UvrD [Candidatus Berkelbacteria bacterium]
MLHTPRRATRVIADFHVHSRFARACSKHLTLPVMAAWARVKGIDLLGTADFTHPVWLSEIGGQLTEDGAGIYKLRDECAVDLPYAVKNPRPVRFILTHEIATIWSQGGKLRRVHTILVSPSIEAAVALTNLLTPRGKLGADGRPILGMSCRELAEIAWSVDERTLVIPAHAWTPWFAIFGSQSGFDSLAECFGADLVDRIPAIETGMSSDPAMNWRLSALDQVALISCSDAHSPDNLGREATVFHVEDALSFDLIAQMIRAGAPAYRQTHSNLHFSSVNGGVSAITNHESSITNYLDSTIEFFPQEGKYHHDGHRVCGVNWSPEERQRHGGICPSCGKPVTIGVLSRIDELADRPHGFVPDGAPGSKSIVPIRDIASEMLGVGKKSKAVDRLYATLVESLGPEFDILLDTPTNQIATLPNLHPPSLSFGRAGFSSGNGEVSAAGQFASIVEQMRAGNVTMTPGFDGVYGKLRLPERAHAPQGSLFQAA